MEIITRNAAATKKLGQNFAKKILNQKKQKGAVVVALEGDLGAGKTTFLQGFAKGLGIKEKITSPTFVILKRFQLFDCKRYPKNYKNFFHIDCYRLTKPEELFDIGWRKIIYNPENIVAIEWSEKIKKIMPRGALKVKSQFIHPELGRRVDKKTRKLTIGK